MYDQSSSFSRIRKHQRGLKNIFDALASDVRYKSKKRKHTAGRANKHDLKAIVAMKNSQFATAQMRTAIATKARTLDRTELPRNKLVSAFKKLEI